MRRTRAAILSTLTVATLALAGCGGGRQNPAPGGGGSAGFPVTVGTVTLAARPTHIVSLSPTSTEMLFAIGAGKQVTAADELSNYPAEAPRSDLSGLKPNAEAIAAKKPDLVVITNDMNKIVDQLTALKIPVYLAAAATTLDDTYAELTDLGKLTGHVSEAADVVRRMKEDIAKLVKDVPQRSTRLTYFYELSPTYYSVTSKTFIGSLFAMVGLDSVADPADANGAAGGYPQLSAEGIVKANPDLIFLADSRCCQQSAGTVRSRPGWAEVAAVRNNRVITLDDDIASRWGPRVVDLLRQIVGAVATVPDS